MLARAPDALDVMVGARIRIFRTHRGMSQSDLAGKIGVAFQQVQKYEKGINRIGASRLSRIAAVLGVSIGELFETSDDKAFRSTKDLSTKDMSSKDLSARNRSSDAKSPFRLLVERDALRLLKAFSRTTDPQVRRAIARLVESLADQRQRPVVKSSIARPAAAKRRERRPRTSSTRT